MYTDGPYTLIAGAALDARRRVKAHSVAGQVVYAGAGEQHIGVTEAAAADGEAVAIKSPHHNGTLEVVAVKAIAYGATLYGAADGKVSDGASGTAIGKALSAATADGDHIVMIDGRV